MDRQKTQDGGPFDEFIRPVWQIFPTAEQVFSPLANPFDDLDENKFPAVKDCRI